MEKKTIGSFIAALRKANGMTQKELAEKLNVSDKSVSRWERDEGAPDLSTIPVIAELFGVSCDELLRGERKTALAVSEEGAETSVKAEKQRKHLLRSGYSKYKTRTILAAGVALAGLIAAMICNFGFLRAYIGFFVGLVFYLTAGIMQVIFANNALMSVAEAETEDEDIGRFRWSVMQLAEKAVGVAAVIFAATLPLVIYPFDTYMGLDAVSWLAYGAIFGAAALLCVSVAHYIVNGKLLKKGGFTLPQKMAAVYLSNRKLKKRCFIVTAVVLGVTFSAHAVITVQYPPQKLMDGIEFKDYESFVAYMEQDVPYIQHNEDGSFSVVLPIEGVESEEKYYDEFGNEISEFVQRNGDGSFSVVLPVEGEESGTVYYDEFGNEISEEEALREKLVIPDGTEEGKVVCEYIHRNNMVYKVSPAESDDGLPITVSTYDDLYLAKEKTAMRNNVFLAAYCLEAAAGIAAYFLKRKR
ncbi:MAG: helix-turn-helix transcriptional regulator [Oscillospiraceae bacterium]|nr:helix-turn-helix transcriptional regulator [Oscillospiraceae bacterium]